MNQLALFSHRRAEQAKINGLHFAESVRVLLVRDLRVRLIELARTRSRLGDNSGVYADDAYYILTKMGHAWRELGNAAGALFRGPDWQWSGEWIQSERVSNHHRMIRKWRLR